MSDNVFERLSSLLLKQLELQNKLLVLEEHKTKVLIEGDIEKLDEVLRLEQPVVLKCTGLEDQREKLLKEVGLSGLTFRQIIENSDMQDNHVLKDVFEKMSSVLIKLKKTNDMNNKILQSRLSVIDQCFSLIGLHENALTYNENGRF